MYPSVRDESRQAPTGAPWLRLLRDEEAPAYDGRPARVPFVKVPVDVLRAGHLSAWARLTYALLVDYRGSRGCFPGREALAVDLGVSIPTVDRALTELVTARLVVKRRRGRGNTNAYALADESSPVMSHNPDESSSVKSHKGDESSPVRTLESSPVRTPSRAHVDGVEQDLTEQENEVASQPAAAPPSPNPAWSLFEVLCAENGADPTTTAEGFKRQQLGIAKRLAKDGYGAADVRACVGYLRSQSWRSGLVDLRTVASEIGKWAMAGRPIAEARASPNGRTATSKAEMTATAYEYFKRGAMDE